MILKTAHKIAIATIASKGVLLTRRLVGLGSIADVTRHGVRWRLDLREGIDFSIYLLGSFEPRTVRTYAGLVKSGDIVLDIGANIGAHTLVLARLVGPAGRVIAFEPTAFAFNKLGGNVALNPDLAPRISPFQSMLVAERSGGVPPTLFSSWPLSAEHGLHAKHKGRSMTTDGASAVTLDDAVRALDLQAVDFIKIDVDGHELPVLRGGQATIDRFCPAILIELAPHVHEEEGYSFDELITFFDERGYRFFNANGGKDVPVDATRLRTIIPDGGCINVLASPAAAA
jgi:FkbM family methyltransferase